MCKANKYLLVKNYEMLLFIKVWESISKEQAMTTESQITMFWTVWVNWMSVISPVAELAEIGSDEQNKVRNKIENCVVSSNDDV